MTATDLDLAFEFAYGSGRFDKSPASLEEWLDRAMAVASVGAGTEVESRARLFRLKERGFGHHSGAEGDARQLYTWWSKGVWTFEEGDEFYLSEKTYVREGGATAPRNKALVTVLRHQATGYRLAIVVFHLPAGIEGGSVHGFLKNYYRAVVVWTSAARGTKAVKRHVKKTYHPDGIALGGDSNTNFNRTAVAAFWKALFPRAKLNFKVFDGLGTLGRRWIDVFLLWGLRVITEPEVRRTKASDHRWYHQTLAFKRRPRV